MYYVKTASKSEGRDKPSYTQYDLVAYKLFLAQKLKSILKEQERLKWHLGQLDDLEWGLREHYYTFDDYRTDYLTERYRRLQCRVRQMKDENRHLQWLTRSQLEEHMFAQATLNTSTGYKPEWIRGQQENATYDISTLNFLGRRHMEHGTSTEGHKTSTEGHKVGTVKIDETGCEVKLKKDIGWSSSEKKEDRRDEGSRLYKESDYDKARAEIKTLIDNYFEAKGKSLHSQSEAPAGGAIEIREPTWVDTSPKLNGSLEQDNHEVQGTTHGGYLRKRQDEVTETSLTKSKCAGDTPEIHWREKNVIHFPREASRKISQTSQKTSTEGTSGAVSGSPKISVLNTNEASEPVYSAFTKLNVKQNYSNEAHRSDCGTIRHFDYTLTKPSSKSDSETLLRNTTGDTPEVSPRESPSEKSYTSRLEIFRRKEMSYGNTSRVTQDTAADKFSMQSLTGKSCLPRNDTTIISTDSSCQPIGTCPKEAKYDVLDADFEIISDDAEKYLKENHFKPAKVVLPSVKLFDSTANSTTFRSSQSLEKYYKESQYDTIDAAYKEFSDNAKMHLKENSTKTSKVSPSAAFSTPFRSCWSYDNCPKETSYDWSFDNYPKETNYDTIDGASKMFSNNGEIYLNENKSSTSNVSHSMNVSEPLPLAPNKDRSMASSEVPLVGISNSTVEETPQFVYSAASKRYILQRQSNTGGLSDNAPLNSKRVRQDVALGSKLTTSLGNTLETRRDTQSHLTKARARATHDGTEENSGNSRGGASERNTQIPSPVGSQRSTSDISAKEELKFIYDASSRRYILQRETTLTNQNHRSLKCPEEIHSNTPLKNTAGLTSMTSFKETQIGNLRKASSAGVKRSQSLLKTWPGNRPESSTETLQIRDHSGTSMKQAPNFVYSGSSKRYILQKDGDTIPLSDRSTTGVSQGQHPRAKGPDGHLNDEIVGKLKVYETREYYDKWAANGTREGTVRRPASRSRCQETQALTEDDDDSWTVYEASRNRANLAKKGKLKSKQSRIPVRLPARLKEHIWL